MIHIALSELIEVVEGELLAGSIETEFENYRIDSRLIETNEMFIPIVGDRFNGNDFIEKVFELGASVSLISDLSKRPLDIQFENRALVYVKDTLVALQRLSAYLLMKAEIPVVAVTGSTGKTSTKEMIASILGQNYNVLKNEGNFNNHIGLPLTLLRLTDEHEIAVLEMGMSGFGEIQRLAAITQPKIGVITNIGESHIERLGSQEGIYKAKMEIASFMKKDNLLIVNGDDPFLKEKPEKISYHRFAVGENAKADLRLKSYELTQTGSTFKILYDGQPLQFELNIPGYHSIQNAMLAIGVGLQIGLTLKEVKEGIKSFEGCGSRLHVLDLKPELKLIDDAYNASPDSMKAALSVLSHYDEWYKVAVLGDMLEMGEFGQEAHERVGNMAMDSEVDELLLVGPMMKHAKVGALKAGGNEEQIKHFENREELNTYLTHWKKDKTILLVKGSLGMDMKYFIQQLKECVK